MSKIKIVLSCLVVTIVIIILLLCIGLKIIDTPTSGNKIGIYPNPQKALLIIDIQEDYTGNTKWSGSPYTKQSDKYIELVNSTIKKLSGKKTEIVYIKQEFEGFFGKAVATILVGGLTIKGDPGTQVDKRIIRISDNFFSKPVGDAFSNPELETFLVSHQINELYLAGLDAEYCVHRTAKGALNRGYKVNIITDCILLGDMKKWNAILEKYKSEGIILLSSSDLK